MDGRLYLFHSEYRHQNITIVTQYESDLHFDGRIYFWGIYDRIFIRLLHQSKALIMSYIGLIDGCQVTHNTLNEFDASGMAIFKAFFC